MPVGKGSLIRASKIQNEDAVMKSDDTKEKKTTTKTSVKKPVPKKKTVEKKDTAVVKPIIQEEKISPTVVTASVITSGDSIHEKKFEAISKITCDLPTYLL